MGFLDGISHDLVLNLIVTFISLLAALQVDEYVERRRTRQRAKLILRELSDELGRNYRIITEAETNYRASPWGRSFYISTMAWENANSNSDLPDVIGPELADVLAHEYSVLFRLRYYVDLMTQLWLTPDTVEGYETIRQGFRENVLRDIARVAELHLESVQAMKDHL